MSMSSTYKPSPLSYGSPRTSPFRRPESPAPQFGRPQSPSPSSPSLAMRPSTPTLSPTKVQAAQSPSPSKLQNASTPTSESGVWTPRGLESPKTNIATSPTRTSSAATTIVSGRPNNDASRMTMSVGSGDAISKLAAPQVRELRESFQTLDRDNDGLVNRDDVVDMLKQLGQPSEASDVSLFFPPGVPQKLPLPSYLSTLATLLAPLSSQQEMLNAFAAFDDHDTGEIDVKELMDALMHVAPEPGERALNEREVNEALEGFTGRRAFGKSIGKVGDGGFGTPSGKREVFKYRDWVGGIMSTIDNKVES